MRAMPSIIASGAVALVASGTDASPATVTFGGDLFLGDSSTTEIELFGTELGEFDRLEVAGDLTLGGTLEIVAGGGFEPLPGDRFEVLIYASVTGAFAGVADNLGLPGLDLDLDVGPVAAAIVPVRLLAGDANFDGVVNLADFGILRSEFGGTGRNAADFNGDGVVNLGDFGTLRANFGSALDAGVDDDPGALAVMDAWAAGIPEPSAGVAALGLAAIACGRRRRGRS